MAYHSYQRITVPDNTTSLVVAFGAPVSQCSVLVSNQANITVEFTNSSTPNDVAEALWATSTLTANAVAVAGPVTAIRLTTNGNPVNVAVATL
jgi:hypothetical protein